MEVLEEKRIMTLHPQGKKGVNILQRRYDFIKDFILETLAKEEQISYQALNKRAVKDLKDTFDGKIGWYVVSVKLDLEAREVIERVPKTSPHEIRMK